MDIVLEAPKSAPRSDRPQEFSLSKIWTSPSLPDLTTGHRLVTSMGATHARQKSFKKPLMFPLFYHSRKHSSPRSESPQEVAEEAEISNPLGNPESLELDDTVQFFVPAVNDLFTLDSGKIVHSGCTSLENLRDALMFPKMESFVQPKIESFTQIPQIQQGFEQAKPYSLEVRRAKIAKYKAKLSHRRAKVPISRHFAGRSHVAKCKNRVNGKFTRQL